MTSKRTYILAPNFTYTDNDPTNSWLGRIIADPLVPTRVLDPSVSSLLSSTGVHSSTMTVSESSNTYRYVRHQSLDTSVFGTFFQLAFTKLSGSRAQDEEVSYSMMEMETRHLVPEPNEGDIMKRMEENPRIQAAMDAGLFGRKPVYMITGVKIAKGLKVDIGKGQSVELGISGEATVDPAGLVAAGASAEGSKGGQVFESWKCNGDVIFAYQLHIIAEKGWRKKRIEVQTLSPRYAFLDVSSKEEDGRGLDISLLNEEDLHAAEYVNENVRFGSIEFRAEIEEGGIGSIRFIHPLDEY